MRVAKIVENKVEPRENVQAAVTLAPATNQLLDLVLFPVQMIRSLEGALPYEVCHGRGPAQTVGTSAPGCLSQSTSLGLLEDIDLGADLEGRAQLEVHGTHKMLFLKEQKGLSINLL